MHQAMVLIMEDRIRDQFVNEAVFCQHFLDLPLDIWNDWKKGMRALPNEKMQTLKRLFSDYEWMLIQKITGQTVMFPEKRQYVVSEYKRLKAVIAQTWVKTGLVEVELVTQKGISNNVERPMLQKNMITLRMVMKYGEWGYDDILEFCMPGVIQQQIEDAQIDLLEWVDENLTDAYTDQSTNDQELPH